MKGSYGVLEGQSHILPQGPSLPRKPAGGKAAPLPTSPGSSLSPQPLTAVNRHPASHDHQTLAANQMSESELVAFEGISFD